ncbi:MAG TPA: hypothetical protein VFK05_01775 [Polyangiaceae bacterium]|nr:hypothetical protein [Polyangiaceae bacterium]
MTQHAAWTPYWFMLLVFGCTGSNSSSENSATGGQGIAGARTDGGAGTGAGGVASAGAGGQLAGGAPAGGGGGTGTAGVTSANGGHAGAAGGDGATAGSGGALSYSTEFDLTEAPISEHGAWTHSGLDWTQVDTASGRAFGTHSGSAYNDSYAHLDGFPPDVEVSVVIYLDGSIGSSYHEVEILLRWSDSAHDAHGYECNLNYAGGYAEIVRWNGPLGDYTYIGGGQGAGGGHKPSNGSVFKARIQGNIITTSLDGVVLQTADITAASGSVWHSGQPGMGFFNGESGKYGLQSYAVQSL